MDRLIKLGFRHLKLLTTATLTLSFEYFVVTELELNRLYRLSCNWTSSSIAATKVAYNDLRLSKRHAKFPNIISYGDDLSYVDEQLISSNSAFPKVQKYVRVWYKFSLYYHGLLAVKYVIIYLVNQSCLKEYRFIGCYLLGRLVVNGRVTEFNNFFAFASAFFLFIWRIFMVCSKPKLKMYCFEFLMYEFEELILYEANMSSELETKQLLGKSNQTSSSLYYQSILQCKNRMAIQEAKSGRPITTGMSDFCLMRLNRTSKHWKSLSKVLIVYWIWFLLLMLCAVPFTAITIVPVILTRKGFEVSYHECSGWISDNNRTDYEDIHSLRGYESGEEITPSLFLPLRDFCPFNLYHSIRIGYDFLENIIIYFDLATALMSNSAVAILASVDVCHYGQQLSVSLMELNKDLAGQAIKSFDVNLPMRPNGYLSANDDQLNLRIQKLQSLVLDYFEMIADYDRYASALGIYTIICWLSFSAIVSKWILVPGSERPKLEWYLLHGYATVHVILNMGSFARVRLASRRLYPLMATTGALDRSQAHQKTSWFTIMKYFAPKPLYCFRMLQSMELSWFLLLKVASWLLTALIVASSFFSVYATRVTNSLD